MKIWDIAHPSDREACHLMWQGVQEGQRNRAQFELFCLTKTGDSLWAKIGLSLVRDEHDVPQYFIYQFDDRTQHKHMEEALWQQTLRNELILQAASDGFCMINDQGVIQEVNPAFAAITGYRQEELLDRELRMLEAGEVPDRIDVYMAEALQHQSVRFETTWRRKDGQVARLAGSISLVEIDRTRFFFISVEDVTERRRSEQALRASEERFRSLFEDVPIALWEEDFSAIKRHLDGLAAQGVADVPAYLDEHLEEARPLCRSGACAGEVNQATRDLFGWEDLLAVTRASQARPA